MTGLADLQTGDLGFGPIGGSAGLLVGLGEIAVAPVDHWANVRQWWRVRHCGTVVQPAATPGPDGPMFAQAEPAGYEIVELGEGACGSGWVFLRPRYAPGQAATVAAAAERMARKQIPYGFEDYAAIAGHRAGIRSGRLDAFISRVDGDGDPQRAICSQGVDAQLTLTGGLVGGQVFDDGRLPQDVTPSELYLRLLQLHSTVVFSSVGDRRG